MLPELVPLCKEVTSSNSVSLIGWSGRPLLGTNGGKLTENKETLNSVTNAVNVLKSPELGMSYDIDKSIWYDIVEKYTISIYRLILLLFIKNTASMWINLI
jgi:hypothetical protein